MRQCPLQCLGRLLQFLSLHDWLPAAARALPAGLPLACTFPSGLCSGSLVHCTPRSLCSSTPPLCTGSVSPSAVLQLVEQFAEEAGVAFLPKPGRTHQGLQVGLQPSGAASCCW